MEFRFNGVSERDMDLLFLEEFAVNPDFLNLFIQKIETASLAGYKIASAEVSFVDPVLGESDLAIVLEHNGHKAALLIENKIAAVAQPQQYERYVKCGEQGIQEKLYDIFYVFLIAPAAYFPVNDSEKKYPLEVTYEECRDLFSCKNDARSRLKYQQIIEAIKLGHG
ncbi:MAG: PD-(D/E)XK nuclease family protein [Ruminiclostridium sp.]|nr:PD-(D/E)XK nuclease family protein [Ruminiclostridium sp.]